MVKVGIVAPESRKDSDYHLFMPYHAAEVLAMGTAHMLVWCQTLTAGILSAMNIKRSINKRLVPLMVHCRETVQNAVRRTFKPSYDDQLVWVMARVLKSDSCCIDVGA